MMKTVLYASSTIDEENYQKAVSNVDKTDQQAQKFNRSVLRGFAENGINTIAISYRRTETKLPNSTKANQVEYRYLDCGKGILKYIKCLFKGYKVAYSILKENEDALVFADGLSIFICWGVLLASKKMGVKSCAFVTDVPGIYNKGFLSWLNKFTLSCFDGYVFLTDSMNTMINKTDKPYTVMEGIYSGNLHEKQEDSPKESNCKRILYAGILDEKYGVKNLVEAIDYLDENIELHLFGTGDCVNLIKTKQKNDRRIKYWGVCDNSFVIETERKMDLLVNPRSKDELFTQYSFPSKTIEYMSTGVPVLMQRLPGMPEEYHEYLYLYEGDTPELMADAIKEVLSKGIQEMRRTGVNAQKFIVDRKNSKKQIEKVIDFSSQLV